MTSAVRVGPGRPQHGTGMLPDLGQLVEAFLTGH
jgi:hypothetical protein